MPVSLKTIKLTMCLGLTLIVILCCLALLLTDSEAWKYGYCGAVLSIISMIIISANYIARSNLRNTSFDLLIMRSFCDLGLALRFLFDPYVARNYICPYLYECPLPPDDVNTNYNEDFCATPSATFEFAEMASEAWFICLSAELLISLNNPFTTYKSRIKYYHLFSWTFAAFMSMIVGLRKDVHGFWFQAEKYNHTAFCWIKGGLNNFLFFLLFYMPIAIAYLFSIGVFWLAYEKLREGIASTFNHRLKALIVNSANILVFTLYWSILLLIYVIMSFNEQATGVYFYRLVMFGLSAKGVADLFVWIVIADSHTFVVFSKIKALEEKIQNLDLNKALRQEVLQYSTAGLRECASRGHMAEQNHAKIIIRLEQKESPNPDSRTALEFYQFIGMIFNFGESDRGQNLEKYQTRLEEERMAQRASLVEMSGNDLKEPFRKTGGGSAFFSHPKKSALMDELEMHIALKDYYLVDKTEESDTASNVAVWNVRLGLFFGKCLGVEESEATKKLRAIYAVDKGKYQITFEEYEPYYFRKIRLLFGVNDDLYMEEFLTTIKERVTEGGASGAFFFFSKSESFIAKSCKRSELDQLRSMAKAYCEHMSSFPHSYITRVYGVYMLRIYGTPLYFFVMNNLFLTEGNEPINEKYDIKGSYVNRNASYPKPGDISTCTFCNQKYVVPKKQRGLSRLRNVKNSVDENVSNDCFFTVGGHHEPNVVMKDNDLKHKLRLPNRTAQIVRVQLEADAKFLLSVGVMDYSLLLGVSTAEYNVGDVDLENHDELLGRTSSASTDGTARLTNVSVASPKLSTIGKKSDTSDKSVSVEMSSVVCNKKMVVSKVVGPKSYYIGIVDFLQSYDFSKRLERYFKIYVLGKDPLGLSAAEPKYYMDRFMDKIDDLLPSDNQNTSFSVNTVDLDTPVGSTDTQYSGSAINPIVSTISSSDSSSV